MKNAAGPGGAQGLNRLGGGETIWQLSDGTVNPSGGQDHVLQTKTIIHTASKPD